MSLLKVKNLCIDFIIGKRRVSAVSEVSFSVERGKILAVVGESGCGKSISNLALTRLLPENIASIRADGIEFEHRGKLVELIGCSNRELRKLRGSGIAYIFQEPSVSLNPVFKIGDQIAEAVRLHRPEVKSVKKEVLHLLELVGIPDAAGRYDAYPHELSGGMQQRVMIAMALGCNPELLIADEPTTALDVTIQAQILELISRMCRERNMGVILVTHNLGIVAQLADEVAVMYAGHIVERGRTEQILHSPRHPYTAALLLAVPHLGKKEAKLATIRGSVPSPADYPKGCRFFGRCNRSEAMGEVLSKRCAMQIPAETMQEEGHFCRCFYPLDTENGE